MSDIFRAGDTVPGSGIYKVVHHNTHIPTHYVTAIYGDTFPRRRRCSNRVRFEIALAAVHVGAPAVQSRLEMNA